MAGNILLILLGIVLIGVSAWPPANAKVNLWNLGWACVLLGVLVL